MKICFRLGLVLAAVISLVTAGLSAMPSVAASPRPYVSATYKYKQLNDPANPNQNIPHGINKNGDIVGYRWTRGQPVNAILSYLVAPPYRRSDYRPVLFPHSQQTQALGINDEDTVVGSYSLTNSFPDNAWHGFWEQGGHFHAEDFPTSQPASSPQDALFAVNDKGVAVGTFETADGPWHAYWYSIKTGRSGLLLGPKVFSEAAGINDRGTVVGWVSTDVDAAFMIKNGVLTEFGFPGSSETRAEGVNDQGVVSGTYSDKTGTHGFTWTQNGGFTTHSHWSALYMNGINSSGEIAGSYKTSATSGQNHGFLAVPNKIQ